MAGYCQNCGKPLPKDSTPRRKFCDNKGVCRNQAHRMKRKPTIKQQAKIPPSNGTGDQELDDTLFMKVEASLRGIMLKELLDKRKEEGRRDALQDTEQWKEDRTLDDATAKRVAKLLVTQYDPSGTQ
jgi:hypothetical protein